jgi:hypothetical protein
MKPEDEALTTQQSISIITEMINNAKGNVKENSIYFLLWGTVIAIANIGMFTLIQVGYAHPYIVWAISIPAWIVTIIAGYKQGKRARATSHLDRISAWLWFSFGIVIFTLVVFGEKINWQMNSVIMLMSTIPTVVSGIVIKFRPLIIGGVCFWVFGILCFLVPDPWQFVVGAAAVTIGYLIPGFMLRYKKANQ